MARTYLLDTQVALWLLLGSARLDEAEFRSRFAVGSSRFIFHQVSTWEVQIKHSLGKLPLPRRPREFLLDAVARAGLEYARIEDEAIFFLDRLPPLHRDPFDRLLASHAATNGWTIITADRVLADYPVLSELV